MKLIDVHAHLEHDSFRKDLDKVIDRFKEAGGEFVINSGTEPEKNRETLALAEKYDVVKASFGMYPVGDYDDVGVEIVWIEEHADVCVAIGEIGLDFDTKERRANAEGQKKLFRRMLELAKKLDKAVVIHSRKAELEAIEILEEMKMDRVIMHCFCGDEELVRRCVDNGWSFSVPPAIMRWDNFRVLVGVVPLGQLLTETDAPYLGVEPKDRNEPVNVGVTVREIARIKGLGEDEVGEQIFINAKSLFNL